MLICMFQVRLKISNSCRCFYRCRKAVPDSRTSVGERIFHTICNVFGLGNVKSAANCLVLWLCTSPTFVNISYK